MLTLSVVDEPGPTGSSIGVQLAIIIILIIINAFFAASELAILSSNDYKIDALAKQNNKKAILVKKLKENDTKFLSTIQVGITLAGFFSSATAAVSLSEGLGKTLAGWNIPFASQISLVVVTLILSYFTLVLGELFPKRIALRNPEKVAMAFARPINTIRLLFKPIVALLSASCELLVRLFRLKPNENDKVTEDEIKALVSSSVEDGVVTKEEQKLIDAVFTFGDLKVRDVMTPRINVCMIDIDDDIETIMKIIKEEKYTRIPVYKNNMDNVIGILNIKDLILTLNMDFSKKDLKSVLRKPMFVIENMKADTLFKKLQKAKKQTSLVIDELGSIAGYVTMEDLIEEVMGNIDDEYDEPLDLVKKVSDNVYLAEGIIPLQDLNRELEINIRKDNDEYSSLAGFITDKLEVLPDPGTEFELEEEGLAFKILKVENNRVKSVQITKIEKKTAEDIEE